MVGFVKVLVAELQVFKHLLDIVMSIQANFQDICEILQKPLPQTACPSKKK